MTKNNLENALAGHVSGQANKPLSRPAHALTYATVTAEVGANSIDGLTTAEAQKRIQEYGRNEIGDGGGINPAKILARQVVNAMTLVLVLAMAVSFAIKSWIEGGVVAAIVCLNVVIGFLQEFQAEKNMDSLRSLSSPTANAVRDGKNITIPTAEIVPGDMVEVKTGDTVPADIRLIEAVNFETDEALLTGESLPVRKDAEACFPDDTGPGDRLNVAFSSSTVTKGRARGIVFATGMYTEIGTIAAALRTKDSKRRPVKRNSSGKAGPHRYAQAYALTGFDALGRFLGVNVGTPLQQKLSWLAIFLLGIAIVCAIIVVAANRFRNEQEIIIYAVGTGLSMIPASLIVVLTITMAAGTKRMVERNVIVRNLKSLEALGAVTDICSDKTGTLTQGKMVAKKAWIPSRGTISCGESSHPYDPTDGMLFCKTKQPRDIKPDEDESIEDASTYEKLLHQNPNLMEFLKVSTLANLAHVHQGDDGSWHARGDPTEIALQVFASRFQLNRTRFTSGDVPAWKQIAEYPFDSSIKKMSVIFEEHQTGKRYVFTKGAVERIIDSCTDIYLDDIEAVPVTSEIKDNIIANMEALASLGLRVLALASREFTGEIQEGDEQARSEAENGLTFRGLVGIYDPPRPESAPSVRQCQEAGIVVHMLTGDHPGTASAIAAEVGILPSRMDTFSKEMTDAMVMTAAQFDKLSDDEIDQLPVLPLVIARCSPTTKVRMIEALHRRKKFAAMTGDGVNDSPSLKRADVGIAMGQAGSDVAKDASDIVLTDDNFASILNAIEEGRRMFDNIQKFILHLLAENVAQAVVLLVGLAFKDSRSLSVYPLAPVQIMWVIMITSGMPDMGLGFEKACAGIMERPPQDLKTGVFTPELLVDMIVYGLWISVLCLGSFSLVLWGFGDGSLGENCNNSYSNSMGEPICDTVFRARATTFACLTWFALFLAWEMVDMRRSFFRMQPNSKRYFTQWAHDVWRNKFLFWAIIAGFVTIFPTLYIPVINHDVFRHEGISWEWGIVFIAAILFFAGVEAWKWAKRVYFRRKEAKAMKSGLPLSQQTTQACDPEMKIFAQYGLPLTNALTGDTALSSERRLSKAVSSDTEGVKSQ
ncbi:ATPase P-type K/Mg/Cd/Cu/Zn/Na/Ca/Na/H-transporter [Lasiodiplodia theobromae]|uniref:ATPAse P-type K/Mg/Cd/Cu/Zn/Na/Ca/Na/H-transporter n=1 Tax=Lasiodiplodia theobromae TaxID=45133 RepID=UPI0015C33CE8|nr:ATPAse P-type K/Mg/Cd/Cu/Zn/Na/Ca/Na/H-transporter [Lasiodiplodia theobromae]KAF4544872.1 ATPAse P-type K/Mg/Cd/Cu/Zn/Na/Ca/Na/H-transporter [Lasiodiplodia theobromae]KAF9637759.1 ATPase P-type K/Mg/Cd/Cu/Zn/Na/Ca/Na/H-transporter [Lasiodiplodia theobromae]